MNEDQINKMSDFYKLTDVKMGNQSMNDIAIIFCLPLSDYPIQPSDISKAEPIPCPDCKELMWFSEKKKVMKQFCESIKKEVIFCCANCLFKRTKEGEFGSVKEIKQIKI